MKKALSLTLICIIVFSLTACVGQKESGNKILDVLGIDYTSATGILEAEGFQVNAIEASVDGISAKLLYPLEKVDKGTVFKIDEYVLDNNGYLNKNYDIVYDGEMFSEDKSLVIYYAKEDYLLENDVAEDTAPPYAETSVLEETSAPATEALPETAAPAVAETTPETKNTDSNVIDPDFKAAMDSYEGFMNEYVDFMKKYKANPGDLSLLLSYSDYLNKYSKFVKDFEKWENEDMNIAETAYYVDVQARVSKKLLEVAN